MASQWKTGYSGHAWVEAQIGRYKAVIESGLKSRPNHSTA